jgi:hypothetical protein
LLRKWAEWKTLLTKLTKFRYVQKAVRVIKKELH